MQTITLPAAKANVPIQENKLIVILGISTWFVVMNSTMFNIALPSILIDLSLNSSTVAWIVSANAIAFALSTLTFSRLSDFIPLTRLLLIGLVLFAVASVLGFYSNQFYVLLIARIVQAIGAGAVQGLGMIITSRYIPIERRGKAMAIIAAGASLGFGLGPVVGGVIIQYLGWHYLFMVTIFVIFLLPVFKKLIPKEIFKKGNFDLAGAVLTAVCVTGVLLFLSTFSYVILIGSLILLAVWWIYLNKKDVPFIQPYLLRNKQYAKLLTIGFTNFLLNFANLFLMPIILTSLFHKEPLEVGIMIFPGAILAVFAGKYLGKFIDTYGSMPIIFIGQGLLMTSSILFAFLSTLSPYYILFIYMFASIGFTMTSSALSNEVSRLLKREDLGSGMGILQLLQFVGAGIGATLSGILITLQEGFSPEIVYRNIFFVLFFLLCIAGFTHLSYYRQVRRMKEEQA
ncbi:MFS transporter [Bacillus dakarensis]|uniref:MFS transporter n=1 Tax=Robertmurraya dakarensis TaxID=1926278 RepID=UPI000981F13C|nr:MFS transporter [Bacillus dakarensis]